MLPSLIAERLAAMRNIRVLSASPVSGGMIHQAARVATTDGILFVKWGADTMAPYEVESHGLIHLQKTQTLPVPEVIATGDDAVPFLALEWLEATTPADTAVFTHIFAEQLAALHQQTIRPDGNYGLDRSNFIGLLPQHNTWTASWPSFYRDYRLIPQIALLKEKKVLRLERRDLLMQVCDALETLLEGMEEPPALLHGDLWSGNFLCLTENTPVVFDPAVYYGPREMELAYIELFGGFPAGFVEAYHSAYPLKEGYHHRRSLHQLYPLLVHYNIFGEPYGARVESLCRAL